MRTRNPSLPADFADLLAAFADADVRYLVVERARRLRGS
jgi:hypothetical protein